MSKGLHPRVLIAGTGSGSGKTTMTCALLMALKTRGKTPVAFKCGPDYIDPMFHRKVTGVFSGNLDLFLMGEDSALDSLASHGSLGNISILEGAMGLYDGIGNEGAASANEVSLVTETPVLLTVSVTGKARSICAEIKGFLEFAPNRIKGILLNTCSKGMFSYYQQLIEGILKIPVIGYLPNIREAEIGSRNLGLITADEIQDIQLKLKALGDTALETFDWHRFDFLVEEAGALKESQARSSVKASQKSSLEQLEQGKEAKQKVVAPKGKVEKLPIIYVSKDQAFCFAYEENIQCLAEQGADIRFFSPLHDPILPKDADGVIIWGGYPELHGEEIRLNESLRKDLYRKVQDGLPLYAEGGGFMFLHSQIITSDDQGQEETIPGVGVFKGACRMTTRLQEFGYATLTAQRDNLLFKKGETARCHSFHRSRSELEGRAFFARKASGSGDYMTGQSFNRALGSYVHLHFTELPKAVTRFIETTQAYHRERERELY
jgi:cobyrinic acid a,c-diamide synthase